MTAASTASYPGVLVAKDVAIGVRDGIELAADVFRPDDDRPVPVIMTLGPYAKDVHFRDHPGGATVYESMPEQGPLMHWETVNPEWWVPQGYGVVRVDARGTGHSPGRRTMLSRGEAQDFYDCIEWAAAQPWSTGRVAVMGISYYAINAWRVAALRPPSLAAIVPWEGAVDSYRDIQRHGGMFSSGFIGRWSTNLAREQGDAASQVPLPPEEYGPPYDTSNPDLAAIEAPLLSVGNWGGAGLHLRGNIEGFRHAGSVHRRLRVHCGNHMEPFYALDGRLEQLRFLEHWLKDIDTGITREPPVKLAIRRSRDDHVWRYEHEWPLARTIWTQLFLDANGGGSDGGSLEWDPPADEGTVRYEALADETGFESLARFTSAPFESETELTGPLALHLWVSASKPDADLFVVVRNVGPDGEEVTYQGAIPTAHHVAAAYGWLRLSHRALDEDASTPWQPVHTHVGLAPVTPGEPVAVDVEIWPTSVVLGPGHRLAVEIRAHDDPGIFPFHHTHPGDRRWGGAMAVHTGPGHESYLVVPVIPAAG
jgi:predicted acyl esterase